MYSGFLVTSMILFFFWHICFHNNVTDEVTGGRHDAVFKHSSDSKQTPLTSLEIILKLNSNFAADLRFGLIPLTHSSCVSDCSVFLLMYPASELCSALLYQYSAAATVLISPLSTTSNLVPFTYCITMILFN